MEVAIIRAVFMKTKMNNLDWLDKQRRIVAYLDSVQARLVSLPAPHVLFAGRDLFRLTQIGLL
jgi:hypothetical protein